LLFEAILWYMAFLISVTIHEFFHGYAAMKNGDPTAYMAGLVTVNPAPHIRHEPFGMVVVPLLSFALAGWTIGWGSSLYNVRWAMSKPRRAALMVISGPVSNLLLAVVVIIFIRIALVVGLFQVPDVVSFDQVAYAGAGGRLNGLAQFISILFSLNILLFIFNVLPFPPMDGSSFVVFSFFPEKIAPFFTMMHKPWVPLIGLIIAWKILGMIFHPLFMAFVNLLYAGIAHYG